jgi:hypothetical protein
MGVVKEIVYETFELNGSFTLQGFAGFAHKVKTFTK